MEDLYDIDLNVFTNEKEKDLFVSVLKSKLEEEIKKRKATLIFSKEVSLNDFERSFSYKITKSLDLPLGLKKNAGGGFSIDIDKESDKLIVKNIIDAYAKVFEEKEILLEFEFGDKSDEELLEEIKSNIMKIKTISELNMECGEVFTDIFSNAINIDVDTLTLFDSDFIRIEYSEDEEKLVLLLATLGF